MTMHTDPHAAHRGRYVDLGTTPTPLAEAIGQTRFIDGLDQDALALQAFQRHINYARRDLADSQADRAFYLLLMAGIDAMLLDWADRELAEHAALHREYFEQREAVRQEALCAPF